MAMPTRTFPQVASAAVRPNAESEALGAIASAPEVQVSDEGDDVRIPTLPFGTKAVAVSPAPKDLRNGKESGARFRFLLPTLPTSLGDSEQQTAATLAWQRANSGHAVRPDPLGPPSRIRLPLLLGASGLAILAFLLLLWPDDSGAPKQASPPRMPPAAVPRLQQGSPESATVGTHGEPGSRIAESPTSALAHAGTPALRPQSSPQQNTMPSPASTAATFPTSPAGPRATVSKALTLKGESVLASVLAPPPAD